MTSKTGLAQWRGRIYSCYLDSTDFEPRSLPCSFPRGPSSHADTTAAFSLAPGTREQGSRERPLRDLCSPTKHLLLLLEQKRMQRQLSSSFSRGSFPAILCRVSWRKIRSRWTLSAASPANAKRKFPGEDVVVSRICSQPYPKSREIRFGAPLDIERDSQRGF